MCVYEVVKTVGRRQQDRLTVCLYEEEVLAIR